MSITFKDLRKILTDRFHMEWDTVNRLKEGLSVEEPDPLRVLSQSADAFVSAGRIKILSDHLSALDGKPDGASAADWLDKVCKTLDREILRRAMTPARHASVQKNLAEQEHLSALAWFRDVAKRTRRIGRRRFSVYKSPDME